MYCMEWDLHGAVTVEQKLWYTRITLTRTNIQAFVGKSIDGNCAPRIILLCSVFTTIQILNLRARE